MGGGAKKKSIAMAEKAQSRALTKEGEEKEKKESAGAQKTGPRSVAISDDLMKTIKKEAPKMNAVTPYVIASKYNVKLSSAKNILRELEKANLLRKACGNHRVAVYAPPSTKAEETAAA
jgi:small subunit ribosomal protein S25e